MDKRTRNISILLGIAILSIVIIEVVRPTPINWNPSYTSFDKIPYGAYILKEELQNALGKDQVSIIEKNPFEFLLDTTNFENDENGTYLFINPSVNIDKQSYTKLMSFVEKGNNVFISSNYFGSYFTDSLKIETDISYNLLEEEVIPNFYSDQVRLSKPPALQRGVYKTIFKRFDTLQTVALGYFEKKIVDLDTISGNEEEPEQETNQEINFIKMNKGKGSLFLHTVPEVFTNYYLLKETASYAATSLSFAINGQKVFWDEYYKSGRKIIDSPMRFVLNQASLKWAYYLLLFGLLVFVIFKGKREQRIIEVVSPLENSTIAFTQTIGDLYFQQKDYSNIIDKKITYFFEKIRSTYHLQTNNLSLAFIEKLAVKTNNSLQDTQELIDTIKMLRSKREPTEQDLVNLHKKMNDFSI